MAAMATYIARSHSLGSFVTYFDLLAGCKWARLAFLLGAPFVFC